MSEQPTPSVRELDRKFVGGVAWTAGGKWSTQLVTWASVIALARILSPEELGLAGMAGLFNVLMSQLAEFGIGSAVVQMRDLKDDAIAQLHTTAVFISCVLFVFAVLASPWIADFFGTPEVRLLVIANSCGFILTGFQSIPMALLRRDLDYRRLAALEVIHHLTHAVVSVGAALLGASYWSTVVGGVVAQLTITILVIMWAPFRFQVPSWGTVRAPLAFGYRVSVSGFANVLTSQTDPLIVARRLGEASLGIYRFAIDIANAPAEKLNMLLMRVSGPLMASIQADHALVRRYFLRIAEPLTLTIFPAVVGFSFVAPGVILILVGEKWEAAIGPIQVLTLAAGIRALSALVNQVLVAQHDVRFVMRFSVVRFCILVSLFLLVSPYGITAVALVWLAWAPIGLVISSGRMMHLTSLRLVDYSRMLLPAVAGCAVMAAVLYTVKSTGFPNTDSLYIAVTVEVLFGAAAYALVVFGLFRQRLMAYYSFAAQLRETRKR